MSGQFKIAYVILSLFWSVLRCMLFAISDLKFIHILTCF